MKTEQEVSALKTKVEKAKTETSELTGQKKTLMGQLKDEWQCTQTADGDLKIQEYLKQLKDIDAKIAENTKLLEETYNV